MARGQFSGVQFSSEANFLGGNCPGAIIREQSSRGGLSGGQISSGVIVLGPKIKNTFFLKDKSIEIFCHSYKTDLN